MTVLYLIALLSIALLAYRRARLSVFTATLLAAGGIATFMLGLTWSLALGYWLPLLPVAFLLNARPLRRQFISAPIRRWFSTLIPPLSRTEREALEAGTVWWDAELFSGKPDWQRLLGMPSPDLRADELAFLNGPVETLCQKLDEWEITAERNDLPPEVWTFIREHRMLGMIIPRAHGGLGFSAQGNSAVVQKIASRSQSAAVTVMVPNSLGPGELLIHFGTQAQKDHYLPRLARGDELPCFALTGPYSGSDAAGMPDRGVLSSKRINGEDVLGFRVNFDKRYITLAPVASIIGLAFHAEDPDGLLGDRRQLGITCALIPSSTRGVKVGDRHRPTGSSFMNGPVSGNDVFVPLDWVIGGRERIGQGWRMLMVCLSAGRAISLPALSVAASKMAMATSSAYARVRQQFNMPLARFEGIEEVLAAMAGRCYRMDAARSLTLCALDQGEKPAVLSAVLKYHLTEDYRRCISDAMDIHGGKGVIEGPSNYLARVYQAVPVAITVEGANILTRSLIIFGQGAIRCHPYLLREMRAAQDPDSETGLLEFDIALFGHIGFTISNAVRAGWLALTGARLARAPVPGSMARASRTIKRLSAAFAVTADLLLLVTGGRFKFMERMSGRLADVLAHLYMASAVVKRYLDDGEPSEDRPVVEIALGESFGIIQDQLLEVYRNFPLPGIGRLLRLFLFPWGRPIDLADDSVIKDAARGVCKRSGTRDRLIQGIHLKADSDDPIGQVEDAFIKTLAAAQGDAALRNALGEAVTPLNVEILVARGLETGIITEQQAEQVRAAQRAAEQVVQVDQFRVSKRRAVKKAG